MGRPYQRSNSRDGIASGGIQPPCFGQLTGPQGPSLTGHRPTGIVAALIQRPADDDWGEFGCGKPPSIRGAGDGELGPNTVARRIAIEAGRDRRTRQ